MDWNSDGKKDLVVGTETGVVRVYLNTGTDAAPVFGYDAPGYITVKKGSSNFDCGIKATPDILDWDNDGDLDLICGETDGVVNLLLNDAGPGTSPTFNASSLVKDGGSNLDPGSASHPVAFDWNQDGKKDLLVGDSSGYVRLYANTGTDANPSFSGSVTMDAGGARLDAGSYSRPEVYDYDSDGVPDLIVGSSDGKVRYYRGLLPLTVTLPAAATEGDGTLATQGEVALSIPPAADVTVALNCDPATELAIPTNVTILAGNTNAAFDITVVDDDDLDGSQQPTVTAIADGYTQGRDSMTVHDNETTTLSLLIESSFTEGDMWQTATVRLGSRPQKDVLVTLTSSDSSELSVSYPTVPAGELETTFPIDIVNDDVIDGPQSVTLDASVENWTPDSATVTILDNEHTNILVSLPDWTGESDGLLTNAGMVVLSGTVTSAVTVSLESSDLTELVVPTTVTIPAGDYRAAFDLTVQNDTEADGQQIPSVTAAATGFVTGSNSIPVADDEIHHLEWDVVPSPRTVAVPFAVRVRMCDVTGASAAFTDSINISATSDAGGVAVEPATTGPLTRGEWTGTVRIDTVAANVRLLGRFSRLYAETAPFDVVPGSVRHFSIAPIPSPQTATLPFGVTIRALDANGYAATGFNGNVALGLTTAEARATTVGNGSGTWDYPLHTWYHDARTQVIYPPDTISRAGAITGLALDVTAVPGQAMKNWTIRMKHTALADYSARGTWETEGWTTVYQNDETITSTGWRRFEFGTPFVYNGTDSLMVDFSYNNDSYTGSGFCRHTTSTQPSAIHSCSDSNNGDPLAWSGTTPSPRSSMNMPNLKLDIGTGGASPETAGPFVDGAWSGLVAAPDPGTNVMLWAVGGGGSGCSAPFDVADWSIATQCAVTGDADDACEIAFRQLTITDEETLALGESARLATGLRFANVPIPAGADVRSAHVQFTAAGTNAAAVELTVTGEMTPDPAPFVTESFNITGRAQTTNSVIWNPGPWNLVDDAGAAQQTPDLANVLREIVSQPGWSSNQAVCLVLSYGASSGTRTAHAHDGAPAKAAVLHVSYRAGVIDQDGDGMSDIWEITHFGTTTNSSGQACDDFDGDGMCDRGEYYCGTDPTVATSVLTMTHAQPEAGDHLVLRWASTTGRTYTVQESTALTTGFVPLATGLLATPPENAHTVTVTHAATPVFYRIRLE